ncbi:MAG: GNAT family N-acetyltransferase [Erysipelotrichaceae bacterium]|nr:GNAT family N-acetyltransferase [Erysipelotrichaceae bacterium]
MGYANDMSQTQSPYIQVRPWQRHDAYALVSICKDPAIRAQWNNHYPYPYTLTRAQQCIETFLHANPLRMQSCALTVDHALCGWLQCDCVAFQSAVLTYQLEQDWRRQYILQEAIRQMCIYSFTHMEVLTIFAKVSLHDWYTRIALLENRFDESRETAPIYLYYLHRQTMMEQRSP